MPCDDSAPEGHKHFPPNGNAFALVGRRLLCYPCSPRALPWAGGSLPLSGVHSSERLLLMGIADMRGRNTRIAHSAMRGCVKEYLCVVIKGLRNVNDVWRASIVPPFDI